MDHKNHTPAGEGIERVLHDPISDKLVPLDPLDLTRVHSVDDLVRAMGRTAFTGRQVGDGADVLEAMARDRDDRLGAPGIETAEIAIDFRGRALDQAERVHDLVRYALGADAKIM